MKILMLTPYLPYPDSSGGQIRTQNLLKHLSRDHEITLVSLIKNQQERAYVKHLEGDYAHKVLVYERPKDPWTLSNILRTGFSLNPFLVVRNYSPTARQAIEQELASQKYDLIHVETFYAMPHIPKTKTPIVLVDQTIEYKVYQHYTKESAPLFLKPLYLIDVLKLKYWERYYWRLASRVVAVSSADRQHMRELEPKLKVNVVPNGVNMSLFKPRTKFLKKTKPVVLFVGNFFWLQNTEAAEFLIREVMPYVWEEIPEAIVEIVGQNQPASLEKLQGPRVKIIRLAETDREGVARAYNRADVFVTPIFGPGGTRLKSFAAMASKLPIVSTTVGMSGLEVVDNQHVLIANEPQDLANQTIKVLKNPRLAKELAEHAYRFVASTYDYQSIAKQLSKIYNELAND